VRTTVLWNRAGQPGSPAIVWQDRWKAFLNCAGAADQASIADCAPGSPGKLKWLLDRCQVPRQTERVGINNWLMWLTWWRGAYADVSNAARTMLFNVLSTSQDDRCDAGHSRLADTAGPPSKRPLWRSPRRSAGRTIPIGRGRDQQSAHRWVLDETCFRA
jgi:sugar (pentulose or hexulose) kinase